MLETVFGYGRAEIAAAVAALLANAAYRLDGQEAVAAALEGFRTTKADFSGCLSAARARTTGCKCLATLDKAMKPLAGVAII